MSILPATNLYSNRISPVCDIGKNNTNICERVHTHVKSILDPNKPNEIDHSNVIAKLGIADTCHDLCQARPPYDPASFKKDIFVKLVGYPYVGDEASYKKILGILFNNTVAASTLEEHVNRYIEDYFNLQPIYMLTNTISYKEIIDYEEGKNDILKQKIMLSNGSLKILLPNGFSSFSEFFSNFTDADRLIAQQKLARFITCYLHDTDLSRFGMNLPDNHSHPATRFLFDAGGSHIAKIYRFPNSHGVRYNAMACTADSASSSDGSLDPTIPNEYESDEEVLVNSNYFSKNNYNIKFKVNPGKKFGVDGTKCFSVTFEPIVKTSVGGEKDATYYFGTPKNLAELSETDAEPCGNEGASVNHLGQTFAHLGALDKEEKTPVAQKAFLNKIKKQSQLSHIPIGDGRMLNLFPGNIIKTPEQMLHLQQLLADYKRTGDYEQSLSVLRKIKGNDPNGVNANTGNYTFATGDLLSALFARLNGIPVAYQTSAGSISLYRSGMYIGTAEQIAAENAAQTKSALLRRTLNMTASFAEVDFIFGNNSANASNQNNLRIIIDELCKLSISSSAVVTKTHLNSICTQFRKFQTTFADAAVLNNQMNQGDPEKDLKLMQQIEPLIAYILCGLKKHFPNLLKADLVITPLSSDKSNLTLPYLNLIMKKNRTQFDIQLENKLKEWSAAQNSRRENLKKDRLNAILKDIEELKTKFLIIDQEKILDDTYSKQIEALDTYIAQNTHSDGDAKKQKVVGGGGGIKRKASEEGATWPYEKQNTNNLIANKQGLSNKIAYILFETVFDVLSDCNSFLKSLIIKDELESQMVGENRMVFDPDEEPNDEKEPNDEMKIGGEKMGNHTDNNRVSTQNLISFRTGADLDKYTESLSKLLDKIYKSLQETLMKSSFIFDVDVDDILQHNILVELLLIFSNLDKNHTIVNKELHVIGNQFQQDPLNSDSEKNAICMFGLLGYYSNIFNEADSFFYDTSPEHRNTNETLHWSNPSERLKEMYYKIFRGKVHVILSKFLGLFEIPQNKMVTRRTFTKKRGGRRRKRMRTKRKGKGSKRQQKKRTRLSRRTENL